MKAFKDKFGQLKAVGKNKLDSAIPSSSRNGDEPPSPSTPPAALSRSVSPGPPGPNGATPPRGAVMMKSGPLPPGAKIIKGPPPGAMGPKGVFSSQGSGTTSPSISPMRPGAKMMSGPPPPGAKVMHGPPPPGAKMMAGPLPPGAKKMMGAPPPGVMANANMRSPTPVKLPPSGVPPGAKIMTGPPPGAKIMSGPPPGAKVMHGPPPPGARMVKAPMSRPTTPEASPAKSPVFSFIGSRPTTPERSGVLGPKVMPSPPSMAGMKKIMSGPPPPGAKIVMKGPPGGSPPLRAVSPPMAGPGGKAPIKMQMRLSPGRPGPPSPARSSPSTPQLIPHNGSFSHPPVNAQSTSQIPRPLPVRTVGQGVPVPPSSATFAKGSGAPSLKIPSPNGLHPAISNTNHEEGNGDDDEVEFHMDGDDGEEFQFDEASPLEVPGESGRASLGASKGEGSIHFEAGGSTNSSNMFREEADLQTAPPPAGMRNKSPSMASIQSSSIAVKTASNASAPMAKQAAQAPSQSPQRRREEVKVAAEEDKEKKRRRKRRSTKKHHKHRERAASSSASLSRSSSLLSAAQSSSSSRSAADRRKSSRRKKRDKKADRSQSPAEVERTRKKERQRSAEDSDAESAGDRHGAVGGSSDSFVPHFSENAMTASALTPPLRSKIADQFLSILCPQQYYGKVKKINGIRPLNADRNLATGLRKHNCIYVATKGVMPNQYFFPQLRLYESDGRPTVEDKDRGALDTPIILYEAAPGNMLFAETELEAQRLLEANRSANSCFVLSSSAILFKDPEHYVLPLAILNVRWVPYASPQSEPQCPIHRKELQLFDPYTKELVCALCASKDPAHLSKLVVIPDVLSGDSRRKIHESLSRQLDEAQHSAKMWVGQHQRIRQLCNNRKEAIQQQFDLLAAAVEAKRREYMEACDAEYGIAQSDVAREVLVADERVQLLAAAADHLRTDAAKPLYSMQIATIAEGLEASKQLPSTFSKRSLSLPSVSSTVMPNLEHVMTDLQRLTPEADGAGAARMDRGYAQQAISNSPFQTRRSRGRVSDQVTVRSPQDSPYRPGRGRSSMAVRASSASPRAQRTPREAYDVPRRSVSVGAAHLSPSRRDAVHQHRVRSTSGRNTPLPSPRRTAPPLPEGGRNPSGHRRRAERADNNGSDADDEDESNYQTDAVTVPNSTGTSLFDYPLDELLADDEEQNNVGGTPVPPRLRKPLTVQWIIRVEDPGDWVGIGVGVGTTIDAWERGRSNDLSHLWIVPGTPSTGGGPKERQVYKLRVTVNPAVGHARLSIHDAHGRQLDDGSIPQWNASRVCYPQVTFGGRIGQVRIIQAPHII